MSDKLDRATSARLRFILDNRFYQELHGSGHLKIVNDVVAITIIIGYNDIMRAEATPPMTSITIRNLGPGIKERLRVRAAEHGHSMEAEARRILSTALKGPDRPPKQNLYERIHARFAALGGADELEIPPRLPDRDPPRFD